ncbi:MAG TPA: carboxypeptidase-like regulatory domain-containing protein [Candidatus Thermoplasmatota archaeon]|nr:carboxypeptidase-like regulatory domain-containing protein [Candidatus Thermoplasmatota archaeon]
MKALFLVGLMASLALAGCSGGDDGGATGTTGGPTPSPLKSGKGAISGLLINDVFRPVPGGLILIQDLGLTATSDSSGQFSFIDLEPGSYLLRVQAEGHEAAPQNVEVRDGEYTEAELVARRVFNEGSRIITTEYSVFIPCSIDFVANGYVADCTLDQSGDSYRAAFTSNYTQYGNATYLVTEMKTNHEGRWEVQLRTGEACSESQYFAVSQFQGDYTKIVMPVGGISEQSAELSYGPNEAWGNQCDLDTILFTDSQFREELQQAGAPVCCGLGAQFGIKAKFVQSIFLGEPEVDIASYGVLA